MENSNSIAVPPDTQMPELRTFVVRRYPPDGGESEAVLVNAHSAQHDGAVLSFITYAVIAGQAIPQMRRAFNSWIDVEELSMVKTNSLVSH